MHVNNKCGTFYSIDQSILSGTPNITIHLACSISEYRINGQFFGRMYVTFSFDFLFLQLVKINFVT